MFPSGWAVIIKTEDGRGATLAGNEEKSETNRMELMAIAEGLTYLSEPSHVTVYTDSANVIGWLSAGWKRNEPDIAALCDIIEAREAYGDHRLNYVKVKGHSGHPENERADKLAQAQARVAQKNVIQMALGLADEPVVHENVVRLSSGPTHKAIVRYTPGGPGTVTIPGGTEARKVERGADDD